MSRSGAAGGRGAPVGAERAEKASPCIPAAWGGAANHALIICIEHGSTGAGIAGWPRGLDCGSARPRRIPCPQPPLPTSSSHVHRYITPSP